MQDADLLKQECLATSSLTFFIIRSESASLFYELCYKNAGDNTAANFILAERGYTSCTGASVSLRCLSSTFFGF